jgi:hypothetical protein
VPILRTPQLVSAEAGIDDQYQRTYTRLYRVYADLASDENYVRKHCGIAPNTPHPTDPRSVAKSIRLALATPSPVTFFDPDDPSNAGNNLLCYHWLATVDYGPWNPLEHSPDGDPLHQPIRFRLDPQAVEEPVLLDKDGVPVLNSASDPFDPPITREVTEYLLTVMRNEADIDLVTVLLSSGQGQVNNDVWNGFAARTVKILPIKIPERMYSQETNKFYFPMEYVFHIKLQTWDEKVVNQGLGELYTNAGVTRRRAILDPSGQPATTPVLLDIYGHKLVQPINASNVVILSFRISPEIDFTLFNLDNLFKDLFIP